MFHVLFVYEMFYLSIEYSICIWNVLKLNAMPSIVNIVIHIMQAPFVSNFRRTCLYILIVNTLLMVVVVLGMHHQTSFSYFYLLFAPMLPSNNTINVANL